MPSEPTARHPFAGRIAATPGTMSRRAMIAGIAASLTPRRARAAGTAATPILAYHRFDPRRPGPTTITVPTFEHQLEMVAASGLRVADLNEAIRALRGGTANRQAVITVDDGHASVYAHLFPIVKRRGLPVTLFVYPSAISNAAYALTWDQLREMRASGLVSVQSHTYWHPDFAVERRRLRPRAYAAFVDDQLLRSRQTIEAHLEAAVDMLAWPFGIVDAQLEAAARKAGYRAAMAYAGGLARAGSDPFALPRVPVGETDRGWSFVNKLGPAVRKGVA